MQRTEGAEHSNRKRGRGIACVCVRERSRKMEEENMLSWSESKNKRPDQIRSRIHDVDRHTVWPKAVSTASGAQDAPNVRKEALNLHKAYNVDKKYQGSHFWKMHLYPIYIIFMHLIPTLSALHPARDFLHRGFLGVISLFLQFAVYEIKVG